MRKYMIQEVDKKYEYEDYVTVEDKMATNEIIRILKYIKRGYIPDYNFTGDEDDIERFEMHVAIDKAINILHSLHVKNNDHSGDTAEMVKEGAEQ